jgi:hypothetical protein
VKVYDTTYLESESTGQPVSAFRRRVLILLWSCAVSGAGAVLVFVVMHIAPAAGAAGGCGGG